MDLPLWLIAIGVLLIGVHASGHVVARLPASPALIYLFVGMVLGPWGADVLHPDPAHHGVLLERACELAVIVSLFATGSSVGTTLRVSHWRVPVRLASGAMLVTILLLALFAFFVLGMSVGAALVLAAALAPTDPVLAGDVHVADAKDRDRLRFGLTGEAGLNDGAAYPFVLLGLALLAVGDGQAGGWLGWGIAVAWGVTGGLGIGAALGWLAGRWIVSRARAGVVSVQSDAFFGLGLMAVAYGTAVTLSAYGFLTVFAAAVALQWTVAGEGSTTRDAAAGDAHIAPLQQFNADLESLVEFAIVIVIGALLAIVAIPLEAIAVTVVLFVIVRPVSVLLALTGVPMEGEQ
ncbi:MAG: cation:proton antiporter, partial [Burkholderiaceae bacterium]